MTWKADGRKDCIGTLRANGASQELVRSRVAVNCNTKSKTIQNSAGKRALYRFGMWGVPPKELAERRSQLYCRNGMKMEPWRE